MDLMTACFVLGASGIVILVIVKTFGIKPDVELPTPEVRVETKTETSDVKKFKPTSGKAELKYIHKGFIVYIYKYQLAQELARQLKGALPFIKKVVPATAVVILALYICTGLYSKIPKSKGYVAYRPPSIRHTEVVRAEKHGVLFWVKPDGVKGRNPDKRNDALDIVLDRNDTEVMAFTVNYRTDDGKTQVAKFHWDKQREQYGNWSQTEPKGSGLWSVEKDPKDNKIYHGKLLNDVNEQAEMKIVMN